MKKLQSEEGKKYTDVGYTFFTDIIYMPDNRDESDLFQIDNSESEKIQQIKETNNINSLEEVDNIVSDIEQENTNIELLKYSLNALPLSNNEALLYTEYYPNWEEYINKSLPKGFKFQYDGDLYETIQPINVVLEHQKPNEVYSLYVKVEYEHEGTIDDPIPYKQQMAIVKGKYYIQYDIIYIAIQDMPTGMPYDLKDIPSIVTPI